MGAIIGTCLPVVAELFYGAEFSASREINRPRLIRGLTRIRCWPFDRESAEEYGRLAAELRRIGRPMQQIDIMIAAVARSHWQLYGGQRRYRPGSRPGAEGRELGGSHDFDRLVIATKFVWKSSIPLRSQGKWNGVSTPRSPPVPRPVRSI